MVKCPNCGQETSGDYCQYCKYPILKSGGVSSKHRKKPQLVVDLIGITQSVLFFTVLGLMFCLALDIIKFPEWSDWLTMPFVVIVGGGLIILLYMLKESYVKKVRRAGYGISALESIIKETDRTIRADTSTSTKYVPGYPSIGAVSKLWSSVEVEHTGKVPCVVEVVNGYIKGMKFYDNNAYIVWKRQVQVQGNVANKVKIEGRQVPTAYPKKLIPAVMDKAGRIFDVPDIVEAKGIVRIEEKQVLFLQKEEPFDPEYWKMVGNLLVRLAERTEKEFGTKA